MKENWDGSAKPYQGEASDPCRENLEAAQECIRSTRDYLTGLPTNLKKQELWNVIHNAIKRLNES